MKEKKYVVGVDLGTTSTKTVIFDFEGNVVGAGQVEKPSLLSGTRPSGM